MPKTQIKQSRLALFADRCYRFLINNRRPRALFLATAAAIAMFMIAVLGPSYILGKGPYWQDPPYDASAHQSGLFFYEKDSWHLPLFDSTRMNYPDGASVIYTDSIPLVALFGKMVSTFTHQSWNYLGFFVLAAVVLNGISLLWLLRQIGISNILAALFAIVFACFTTLYNIQFESLFAHFLVIFSFGFYIKLTGMFDRRTMGIFSAMVIMASLVHPYLFVMSLAIYLVTLFTLWFHKKISLRQTGAWFALFLAALAGVFAVAGHLHYKVTGYQEQFYGTNALYALDLSSPFTKQYTIDEIGVYFGLGAFVLIGMGVWLARHHRSAVRKVLRHHWALVTLCVGFLLFAISNTIFLKGVTIAHFDLPAIVMTIADICRASRRFVIPVYYALIVFGFVMAVTYKSKKIIMAVVLALILQMIDVRFFIQNVHTSAHRGEVNVTDKTYWQSQFNDVEKIYVFPSYSCMFDYRQAPLAKGEQWKMGLELYQYAAAQNKISNSARVAKRTKNCIAEADLSQTAPEKDSIFIYLKDDNDQFMLTPSPACLAVQKPFAYGISCKHD